MGRTNFDSGAKVRAPSFVENGRSDIVEGTVDQTM
jgi:hypothetical protein